MRIKTEIQAAIGALLAVLILSSFGMIGLLARMTPAIEHILEQNVSSLDSVETMLVLLARPRNGLDDGPDPTASAEFESALERLRSQITEPTEVPLVQAVTQHYQGALSGDRAALDATIDNLERLADVNRNTMVQRDVDARRLGIAGAWAAVFLGIFGFLLSLLIASRLTRRVVTPFHELYATVTAFMGGDLYRRCPTGAFPREFEAVAVTLNDLLDEHQVHLTHTLEPAAAAERPLLLGLLDRHAHPALVFDIDGHLVASNRATLDLPVTPETEALLARAAEAAARGALVPDDGEERLTLHRLGDGGWLVELPEHPG